MAACGERQTYGTCTAATSAVRCRERVSRTQTHRSVTVCLVTHNTGAAQSFPLTHFFCRTLKLIFYTFHAPKKKKKVRKPKLLTFFVWLTPSCLPLSNGYGFCLRSSSVALNRLVINTGGPVMRLLSLRSRETCISCAEMPRMNDKHFWETDPAEEELKLNRGSVSGGDILRIEEELGG